MEEAEVMAETEGWWWGREEGLCSLTSLSYLRNSLDNKSQQIRHSTGARAGRRMSGGHDCVSKNDLPQGPNQQLDTLELTMTSSRLRRWTERDSLRCSPFKPPLTLSPLISNCVWLSWNSWWCIDPPPHPPTLCWGICGYQRTSTQHVSQHYYASRSEKAQVTGLVHWRRSAWRLEKDLWDIVAGA